MSKLNVVVPFSRPQNKDIVIRNFLRQTFKEKTLWIVENGSGIGTFLNSEFKILTSEKGQSIAKNTAIDAIKNSGGGFWTTFDDDDYYGPNYLQELSDNINKATVIGKQKIFVKLTDDKLYLFDTGGDKLFLNGPTISAWAEDSVYFEQMAYGEDSKWLDDMKSQGASLYSTSCFNFCYNRNKSQHAWPILDQQFIHMTQGEVLFVGENKTDIINGVVGFTTTPVERDKNFLYYPSYIEMILSIPEDDPFEGLLKSRGIDRRKNVLDFLAHK